ncbi:MAG: hypothetical protein HY718_08965 [Planctomycetes bacterium]|nr:hypothetical protein [Planctomycetota bacterium]
MTDQEGTSVEIVEIYVPRRLDYLSRLYGWLKEEIDKPPFGALLRGFSLYEVSGAYAGGSLYTEQTIVVRLIFDVEKHIDRERVSHEQRVNEIADSVVDITQNQEEEVWLIRIPAIKTKRQRRA